MTFIIGLLNKKKNKTYLIKTSIIDYMYRPLIFFLYDETFYKYKREIAKRIENTKASYSYDRKYHANVRLAVRQNFRKFNSYP